MHTATLPMKAPLKIQQTSRFTRTSVKPMWKDTTLTTNANGHEEAYSLVDSPSTFSCFACDEKGGSPDSQRMPHRQNTYMLKGKVWVVRRSLARENALKLRIALLRTLASAAGHPGFWLGCLAIATWLGYGVWAFYLEGQAGALLGPRVARFLQHPPDRHGSG